MHLVYEPSYGIVDTLGLTGRLLARSIVHVDPLVLALLTSRFLLKMTALAGRGDGPSIRLAVVLLKHRRYLA